MNTWIGMTVGHCAILLGLVFYSQILTDGIAYDYRVEVLEILGDGWPKELKQFMLHKLVRLTGKCTHLGQGTI